MAGRCREEKLRNGGRKQLIWKSGPPQFRRPRLSEDRKAKQYLSPTGGSVL